MVMATLHISLSIMLQMHPHAELKYSKAELDLAAQKPASISRGKIQGIGIDRCAIQVGGIDHYLGMVFPNVPSDRTTNLIGTQVIHPK